MLKVGITGNIGSGKSTVSGVFKILGVPVYDSDLRAKLLLVENAELKLKIIDLLGHDSYFLDGTLNRKYISDKIFVSPVLVSQMNAIVHPAVFADFDNWYLKQSQSPYVLKEAALLFESKSYADLNKLIVISAPEDIRIKRTMLRDNLTREAVIQRQNNQIPQEEKEKLADFIILNDDSKLVVPQVLKIHKDLISLNTAL